MKRLLLFITLWLCAAEGCKKPAAPAPSGSGKGGSAVLIVSPVHHGQFVDTCTVYIKYNTLDAPSNGVYDDSLVCTMADTIPVAIFSGLKKGDYYLFARGYHTLYVPPYVRGGLPVTISSQDSMKIYLPTYQY
jgi:hypothetical protein